VRGHWLFRTRNGKYVHHLCSGESYGDEVSAGPVESTRRLPSLALQGWEKQIDQIITGQIRCGRRVRSDNESRADQITLNGPPPCARGRTGIGKTPNGSPARRRGLWSSRLAKISRHGTTSNETSSSRARCSPDLSTAWSSFDLALANR
jgi:hypothetical protein